jgi:hypothetical protein
MILHPTPGGLAAIRQSAHAFVAFQLADHWGNRMTPRPSPRAEVLAAVLLHDGGWDAEERPRLGPDGLPLAFDSWPENDRERIWRAAVERAAVGGRYVEWLVSHHVTHLAEAYSRSSHAAFVADEERRRAGLAKELSRDSRYRAAVGAQAGEINRAILRVCDAVAVHLGRGGDDAHLAGLPQRDGETTLAIHRVMEHTYRLRPWPFVGQRLVVHADAHAFGGRHFASSGALDAAWSAGTAKRLSWTLLATGSPIDSPRITV